MSDDEHKSGGTFYSTRNRFRFDLVPQRKPQRSCDLCRSRKVRCDGPQMPDNCCSNCIQFNALPCTYLNPYRKRGPKNLLVEELKKENATLKAKLRKLSVCSLCAQPLQTQPQGDSVGVSSTSVFNHSSPESDTATSAGDTNEPVNGQDFTADKLSSRFESFCPQTLKSRYYGAVSPFALANSAMATKDRYLGRTITTQPRRSLYWEILPWEKEVYDQRPHYIFPEKDLIDSLLRIYHICLHSILPILHFPSFVQAVEDGLHLSNPEFGGTLLSVLALSSRFSNDPRVFVDGDRGLSAGWQFAKQIRIVRNYFEPTIHEVQMYCILTIYSMSLSTPQLAWLYLGLGIRFLQQRGEHRRRPEGHQMTREDELWKRAFWCILALDRHFCAFVGRPMGLHMEEYDVDPLLEVDDEYWDEGFAQPPGKPSQISYFNSSLRLSELWADVMRKLYGSKKSKILMGWDGPDWEHRTVAELDSAVNVFLDTIPEHVRWNPDHPPEGAFFDQAATLHVSWNYVLISIHRQYIQNHSSALTAPSLSICAGAARAIIHTSDTWLRQRQRIPPTNLINPVFVSGIILVLNMLATKRAGLPVDKKKDLPLVATAMEILKFSESRLQPVGRLWELLREIWSIDGTLPNESPPPPDVRHRSAEVPTPTPAPASAPSPEPNPVQSPPQPNGESGVGEDFFTQLRQSFEQSLPDPQWSATPSFTSPSQLDSTGLSAEQFFHDPAAQNPQTLFDDELMSMWMATPTDVTNINNWDAYMGNRNSGEMNWFGEYGS
ncbi:fungal-trans domain-containing protein [Favolaschia claudopus]|uniref:Fungal-trans domain-containing protein n=1 Tax=Favolaschia claudopus TaxID=2862362 RepID=A0AAW0D6I4_9AGAR